MAGPGGGHTRVVLVLPDLQFHQVLALPQDLHSILHGAVVQADVVDGQQLVTRLKGAGPVGTGVGDAKSLARGTPPGLFPLPCTQGHSYLCATLPFLMSEMIRGSPRFLLVAGTGEWQGGKEAMNPTFDGLSLEEWSWEGPGVGARILNHVPCPTASCLVTVS